MFEQSKLLYNVARKAGHNPLLTVTVVGATLIAVPLIYLYVKSLGKPDFEKFEDIKKRK